jgi:hypothetical protein
VLYRGSITENKEDRSGGNIMLYGFPKFLSDLG